MERNERGSRAITDNGPSFEHQEMGVSINSRIKMAVGDGHHMLCLTPLLHLLTPLNNHGSFQEKGMGMLSSHTVIKH